MNDNYEDVQREIETWSTDDLQELLGYIETLLTVREEEEAQQESRNNE